MMPEISLNILDVAENSVRAKATLIIIEVSIYSDKDILEVIIKDDGCGMTSEQVECVIDPFFTTRTTRKVGLGIPFFKLAAESTGGNFEITSEKGKGTSVKAIFKLSHIDRMPLGDINATIHMLVTFNESIDFYYRYTFNKNSFVLDTKEIREIVGAVSFRTLEISRFLKEYLDSNKDEVDGGKKI
ncbi:MAG: ATP-binding protein [Lachnospiraceae bacterium]|nr:ATP-binding protein [Lachnospiraceae bacterium]